MATGTDCLATDDQEAGGVIRPVLNLPCHNFKVVKLRGHVTGDGGASRLARGTAGGLGVTADGDALDPVMMNVQPLPALGEGLLVGIDTGQRLVLLPSPAHQVM